MDDLGVILNNTNIGCTINNNNYNYIRYADDVCLLSMSSAGMPKLFNICEDKIVVVIMTSFTIVQNQYLRVLRFIIIK